MIIHTVIGNRTHPEYGVASIPFHIPTEEYPRIIEMLEALEVGDVLKSDCHIAELESPLPVLKCLEDTDINVDEMDYLAKRLDSFSDHEFRQFQAMAAKNGYFQLKDLINLTFSCQQVTVISDFSDSMCEAAAGISAEKLGAIIRSTSPESTEQIVVLAQDADSFDFYPGIKTPEDYGKYFIQSSGHYEYDDELGEYYDYERFGKDRIAREHGVFDKAGYIAYNGTLGFDEIMEQDNESITMEDLT